MDITSHEIAEIVSRVVEQLDRAPEKKEMPAISMSRSASGFLGVHNDVDSAVASATRAFQQLAAVPISQREKMIFEIRRICSDHVKELAKMAWEETGLGRYEDKIKKNQLIIDKTPGTEDLNPKAVSGDFGLTLVENAPYGVICAITPTTNPTETVICNSIGMLAAGNAVVFNPHPRAKRCSAYAVHLINTAIKRAGGPDNCINLIEHPTMQTGQDLMCHSGVRLVVVTGGPGVVKAAFASGKKVIAAGPGNPPVVVDETADIAAAAKHIVTGATLDNTVLCIAEKEIFVVDSVADQLIQELKRNQAYQVIGSNIQKLEQALLKDGAIHPDLVGQNAGMILSKIGIHADNDVRMIFFECGFDHWLVKKEQLLPVLPLVRVPDVKTAIDYAVEAEQGNYHTAMMHSRNLDALHEMALRSNVSIFVKNGPSCAGLGFGGEGHTTMSIASPTGEGITSAKDFTRQRRCVLKGHFRIV
jgi:acyl-CoA reductase-like NAD-dependent aldehyde dehydrogenase